MTSILPRCSIAGVFLPLLSSAVTSCSSPETSSICTAQTPPTPFAATPSLPPSTTAPFCLPCVISRHFFSRLPRPSLHKPGPIAR
ncbi:hypothetical protein PF002_g18646 [Phytophthora fragariae]|uniref:RxLR effector protein n=1 Tax=Phytophthora fragariae TaxID=53985 RepID=A0A6A4AU37_9STRA|nr:hypothetical protein PF003_g36153 [Phytophthora fragariae]KAE8916730.1 hypothetical protein PF009_g32947 [Phytophthora fragariae]KAE8980380.1 hypothetical protein PF011_g22464 [Phytophthora fragariae]KAE9053360.1 hypothetical protein PF007_g32970 [Phytophthora fragariae]KAE9211074.1 hypothetical protein PF002_g18646 [Phytophthora fragariae]